MRPTTVRLTACVVAAALVAAGCGGETPSAGGEPNPVTVDPASSSTVELSPDAEAAPTANIQVALMVSGQVDLEGRSVEFGPTRSLPTEKVLSPEPGPFELVLEGSDGSVLSEVAFDVIAQADSDPQSARFNVAVQPQPTTAIGRVRMLFEGKEISAVEGSASIPSVVLSAPVAGDSLAISDLVIEWDANDPDGGELTTAVFFSADGGTTWRGVVTRTTDTYVVPVPGIIEPTDDGRVLVSVSDGVNASFAVSQAFVLTSD